MQWPVTSDRENFAVVLRCLLVRFCHAQAPGFGHLASSHFLRMEATERGYSRPRRMQSNFQSGNRVCSECASKGGEEQRTFGRHVPGFAMSLHGSGIQQISELGTHTGRPEARQRAQSERFLEREI